MAKETKPKLRDDQIRSLQWAIEKLDKEKYSLEEKANSARKREETEELIEEVAAQRKALDKRIGALREGLENQASAEGSGGTEALSDKMDAVREKLEIARERLKVLEQDRYLEDLGRSLSGKTEAVATRPDEAANAAFSPSVSGSTEDAKLIDAVPIEPAASSESADFQTTTKQPVFTTMSESTNRLPSAVAESAGAAATIAEPAVQKPTAPRAVLSSGGTLACSEATSQGIREAAAALDIDPEYVLEKGMQAVLRMIARNGHRMTFPLDVKQVESLG